ncbi:MAG: winged helix-turn-helix domain-containing protein [Alphaproteobacteria bacterium]|nr:winged helix-turn-helix domain-containing protein [Alphaproteobacteria bacterium]
MTAHLPPTVLIVDSNIVSRTTSSNALERGGFIVNITENGNGALEFLSSATDQQTPHVILINAKLDGLSGLELCTIIKTKKNFSNIPVLMIADEDVNIQDLHGLENSFDDYIQKPFIQTELIAKVKNILGRFKPALRKKVISFDDIQMNLLSYRVVKNNRIVHLGPTEFKILQLFVEEPRKIFSRQELMTYVWGNNSGVELRTIDVHINRLRSALKDPGQKQSTIRTVRSAGYCLELPETVK